VNPAKTVLVVDDDVDFLDTVVLVLESRGYRVMTARGGDEALRRLTEGPRPSLILLDLMMPGMHGWEFRDRLLAMPELSSVPVVVLSGDHTALRCRPPPELEACLAKPVGLQALLEAVERHARA
jgi:two-component system, chemotaxis family, chemotaxis protein CheY